ncbi:serine/threonine-protein phosphatase 7 long form homolog [Nicotiana sylvestris]|uniref:Serine/threonine-protein phosphatase 7 long form homolog n=1 Tax=Nicotiana sylvestris TaxID=4096 RepID=A0A1U7VAM7_NICSY|nr:PREDICTED: serine/threonine-protein phosphatase 7 long form homolog [Nicotiana sylvestris]
MDVPHVHPEPLSDELLVLQGDHRSADVWEGELLEQTLCARRVDDLWDFMRGIDFHPRIVQRLRDTDFYRIFEIGRLQLDWSLITALIERWRPETHTFHLPIGEATITLQDVEVLYGLPADGLAVVLPQSMRSISRDQYWDLLQQFTGFRPQAETSASEASRMALTAIRQHLEILHPNITGETDDLHIHRYTSWGAAVLVYLYRNMCQASMGTRSDVWAWERFMLLQPPLPPLPPDVEPPFLPLATRWVLRHGNYQAIDAHHNLSIVRDVLDMLEGAQAIGHHLFYQLGLQMQQHVGDPAVAEYGRRVT